jgi:hypothetical protein
VPLAISQTHQGAAFSLVFLVFRFSVFLGGGDFISESPTASAFRIKTFIQPLQMSAEEMLSKNIFCRP